MTNKMIILYEQVRLMEEGLIGTTGRIFVVDDGHGGEKEIAEPEEIHTFAMWKSLGYSVRKGEKAVAKFAIWKHTTRKGIDENGEEIDKSRMFLKDACWFSASQVEQA